MYLTTLITFIAAAVITALFMAALMLKRIIKGPERDSAQNTAYGGCGGTSGCPACAGVFDKSCTLKDTR